MIKLDPAKISVGDTYRFMTGAIVPRPIAFVSTVNGQGIGNLAPFSYFNAVSSDPPCLMISITGKRDGSKKDTLRNIEETGEFVINTVAEWMAEPMNQCSAEYPYGVNEMEKVGLTPLASERVRPARVKESPIHLECELYKRIEIGDARPGSTTLVIGRILLMHVIESAWKDGQVLIDQIQPLARLGGHSYGKTREVFDLQRPRILTEN